MRSVLNALLPRGSAWVPAFGGGFDGLLNGLGDGLEDFRAFLATLADVREPARTFLLSDLEREFGVVSDTGLTEAVRRTYLHGIKYGAIGLGSDDDVQARLHAAGFTNVFVYQNDPAIDPDSFPGAGAELLVNGDLADHPITYAMPLNEHFWAFVFFVGGARTKHQNFIDFNMEYSGTLHWPAGNGGLISKTTQVQQSGLRSLAVEASSAAFIDQVMDPDLTDRDLLSYYQMDQQFVPGATIISAAPRNLLRDGDMNQTGIAVWTVGGGGSVTKSTTTPFSGRFALNVLTGGGPIAGASQPAIINGRDYTITGRARSVDGTTAPVINDPGGAQWTGTTSTSWQTVSASWTASGGSGNLDLTMNVGGEVEFDSMYLVDDNWTDQRATPFSLSNVDTPLIVGLDFDPGGPGYAELVNDVIRNGDMSSATNWTVGVDWNIAAGIATFSIPGAGGSNLTQLGSATHPQVIIPGGLYRLTYTTANFAGATTIQPQVGGTLGTIQSTNNTFTENIRAGTGDQLDLIGACAGGGGSFDLDDVKLELIDESFWHENLTIELIAKFDSLGAGSRGILSNDTDNKSILYLQNTSDLVLSSTIAGTARYRSTAVDLARYYHIILTREYDGTDTTITLAVDGVENSAAWTGAPDVTNWINPILGRLWGGLYHDGILADHVSFYATAKDSTWIAARFQAYEDALLAGPYASQELDPEVTDSRTLTAAAWAVDNALGDPFPMIMGRLPSGVWEIIFNGDPFSVDPLGLQPVSFSLPSGITEVRLYCKNAIDGIVAFDDVSIDNTEIARVNVDAELEDKLKRLILGAKPLHSWAGLLIDFV